jgi:hypothetical protein
VSEIVPINPGFNENNDARPGVRAYARGGECFRSGTFDTHLGTGHRIAVPNEIPSNGGADHTLFAGEMEMVKVTCLQQVNQREGMIVKKWAQRI